MPPELSDLKTPLKDAADAPAQTHQGCSLFFAMQILQKFPHGGVTNSTHPSTGRGFWF
jgi:hypothetical protein